MIISVATNARKLSIYLTISWIYWDAFFSFSTASISFTASIHWITQHSQSSLQYGISSLELSKSEFDQLQIFNEKVKRNIKKVIKNNVYFI